MSRPGRPLSLADEAYVALRRRLTRCELEPGTAFTAREVAAGLGLGLTPVREALIQLGRERLVVTLPRRGYVAAPLTPSRVDDLLATWRIVKPQVAALAVRRAAPEAVDRLVERLEEVYEAPVGPDGGSPSPAAEARSEAALLLAEQTGNDTLTDVVRFLDGQVLRVQLCVVRRLGAQVAAQRRRDRLAMAASGPSWAQIVRTRDESAAAARAAAETDLFRQSVRSLLAGSAAGPAAGAAAELPETPARVPTPADVAWERLRAGILRGDLPPGTRLTERALSQRLGVGLTPVREALGRLDHERLVITRPRLGYVVTGTTAQEVVRTTEAWSLLVPDLVELGVRHADDAQARAVVEALTTVAPGDDTAALVVRRSAGWRLLARATGNAVLAEVFELVDGVVARTVLHLLRAGGSPLDVTTTDWAGLFARRDAALARQVAHGYVEQVQRLAAWAADRDAQIYQPS